MNGFIWFLSHDEVNQNLARDLSAAHELDIQSLLLKEDMPDGDCRALIVDLDSVAPDRRSLQRLIKELDGRARAYPIAVFGYSLEEDQVRNLKAAGIHVIEHGLRPELFAAILEQASPLACSIRAASASEWADNCSPTVAAHPKK